MSINVVEKKTIEILEELQKIKSKSKRGPKFTSDAQEIDRIRNSIVKKIVNGKISPEYISVEHIAYGCQILMQDAEEIYAYLKSVELI